MSVPLHWTSENLPIGIMFAGRFGAEELLFSLAGQLEQAAPWKDRRPVL
jgi:Asp-tRNA(Asn)/Glu-tRNA(Gln) amidotransferase A subunit family amidase